MKCVFESFDAAFAKPVNVKIDRVMNAVLVFSVLRLSPSHKANTASYFSTISALRFGPAARP